MRAGFRGASKEAGKDRTWPQRVLLYTVSVVRVVVSRFPSKVRSLVLAVAALVGWMMIPVVFGEGFRQAREVLVVLTVAEVVLTLHFMYQALLVGFGRPSGIGLPSVVGAVVMVALNLAMIPAWGMQGAAWACLLGFGALAAISAGWTNRELRRIG